MRIYFVSPDSLTDIENGSGYYVSFGDERDPVGPFQKITAAKDRLSSLMFDEAESRAKALEESNDRA